MSCKRADGEHYVQMEDHEASSSRLWENDKLNESFHNSESAED